MSQYYTPNPSQEEEINIREELDKYLRYWPWFVAGVMICLILALLYLRYATPVYNTTASIIIKDEDGKSPSSEMDVFADLGMFSGLGTNSIENEIGLFKSRRMMTNVVKALNLNIRYFDEGQIRTTEIYQNSPFEVQVLSLNERRLQEYVAKEKATAFNLERKQGDRLQITNQTTEEQKEIHFGVPVDLGFADVVIVEREIEYPGTFDGKAVNAVLVKFSPVEDVVIEYREALQVSLTDKNSSLIELSLDDPVREKAQDVLDQLVLEYNREAIEDKNLVATNTATFIDERLQIITQELDSVETGKENFKEVNHLTDIEAESELFIENASDYKKRQQEVSTQLELGRAMINYLKSEEAELLPANLGITENGVVELISNYNEVVLERNRVLRGSTKKNPVVQELNSEIEQLEANVLRSLQRMTANLEIAQEDLNRQVAAIGSQISTVPSKERQYRGIERQQNIKEALYLFLLEKREENSLSLAVTAPKAKIVDRAYSGKNPVTPKSKIILLAALILGMLIPFLIIYLKNLLNNKVQSQQDLEKQSRVIPIVGEIPHITRKDSELIKNNDRSVLAESFRILHTNLQYLLVNAGNEDGNTIFVTSTVKGEGKTLVAFNLAMTLANANKKVLILGADLRNPQLQRFETDARMGLGVSDYLVGKELQLGELIRQSSLHENLDLLASGSIPPNPSELWRHKKASELFTQLQHMYDYVIVDTAPVMLVTDTFLINKYADLTLYVVRAGYTEKKLPDFAVDAKNDGKLKEVSFVLNDVEAANFGYGNKYGYVYDGQESGFWNNLRKKAAIW